MHDAAVAARISAAFDARAHQYDSDLSYHGPLATELLRLAAPAPGGAALDIGCGTGLVALGVAQAVGPGGRVVGVDLSEGMLQQARAKAAAAGLSGRCEWVHGDAEDYPALLGRYPPGSFQVMTCSAALPFIRDIPVALARWREWLDPQRGRLAFNSFVAPAVLDFGTWRDVARRHGLEVTDPCDRVGSRALVEAALSAAGFSSFKVREEPKVRYYAAASPREYADRMVRQCAGANPFSPVDDSVLAPDALAALLADAAAEIEAAAAARFEEGRGVRSPYAVLHVLARP